MYDYQDRRTKDRSNLEEEIAYLHDKLRALQSAMESHSIGSKEVELRIKQITKGFENTIDSHRDDLNRIGNKQSDIERDLIALTESRRVILAAIGSFALLVSALFYDYFATRDRLQDKIGKVEIRIERFIGDADGKK